MNTNTVTRRDPMKEVMPYELLEVAHKLMAHGQNKAYWDAVPVPKRPVGQVRFEVARQVSTFAVPLAGLAGAWMGWGLKGLLLGLPVAWLTGYLLDKKLERDIDRKWRRDIDIDRGRYNAVKWLSEQMGMARDEITLPVIYKMAEDFRVVDSERRAEAARLEAAQQAAEAKTTRRRRVRAGAVGAAAVAAGGVVYAAGTYAKDAEPSEPYAPVNIPVVNPANGFPMLPGNAVDVAGNPFGTDMSGM
ncbi:hypothetical protein [Burkholderia ubonensis]|uniref:hypothetical protein n=1 Tax=Burkholderia ubonensis TaxID=101571 RepID=UPI0009B34C2E|nr:hypothetical protein [Burkholderia ubonensis]